MNYFFYNWNIVPFDAFTNFAHPNFSPLPAPSLFSVSMRWCLVLVLLFFFFFFFLIPPKRSLRICFYLSDLFQSLQCPQGSSMLSQVARLPSFLCLNDIPLYIHTTFSLSIYPLMNINVASISWLL